MNCPLLWPRRIGSSLGRNSCEFESWQCRIYIIFIVYRAYDYLGSFEVLWAQTLLDTKIVLKKIDLERQFHICYHQVV